MQYEQYEECTGVWTDEDGRKDGDVYVLLLLQHGLYSKIIVKSDRPFIFFTYFSIKIEYTYYKASKSLKFYKAAAEDSRIRKQMQNRK